MRRIVALMMVVAMQAPMAHAAPDLIGMAHEEHGFTLELVQALGALAKGEINGVRDAGGRTMLHVLATRSHQARALAALLAGADPNAKDKWGRTPLFDVLEARDPVFKGDADLMFMEMLALRGADVNARDADGTTPLALAVERGDARLVEFLLRCGAAMAPEGVPPGKTARALAEAKQDPRISKLFAAPPRVIRLVERPADTAQAPDANVLARALAAVDLDALAGFLEAGWDLNAPDDKGQTVLLRATQSCRPELVSALLLAGADPNRADKAGVTPLMVSMKRLGIEGQRVTGLLLLKGANAQAASANGETPLTYAGVAGHDFGVMWLVAAGADPRAKTPKGSLMEYVGHPPTMRLMANLGVEPKVAKPEDTSPAGIFMAAVRRGDIAAVERQLDAGVPAKHGQALSMAANNGRFDIVDLLVSRGADINEQYATGWHIMHSLAGWGPASGDPAVAAGHIEELIKRGANPNLQSKDGTTTLMVSAEKGIMEANTEALLKGGSDLKLRNKAGLTAVGVAKKFGRTGMVEYLKKQGGDE